MPVVWSESLAILLLEIECLEIITGEIDWDLDGREEIECDLDEAMDPKDLVKLEPGTGSTKICNTTFINFKI